MLVLVVGGGMALFIENDPRGRGLNPDGEEGASPVAAPVLGVSVRDAIRTMRFASLYAACLICSFGVFVPFLHLVPFAHDQGIAESTAVLLLGTIGIGSTAGRFFLGGIADRIGRERALIFMFAGMAAALSIWAVSAHVWSLATFALVFGIFYGGWVAVLPSVVMDYFGGRNVSGIIGALYTSVAFGTLIGPSAVGFVFDLSHSYEVSIVASALTNIIAALIMTLTSRSVTVAKRGCTKSEART
jgi:MFS family permease